jgi:hypothetical protein
MEEVKAENLTASTRSPAIPDIDKEKKTSALQELENKAKVKAEKEALRDAAEKDAEKGLNADFEQDLRSNEKVKAKAKPKEKEKPKVAAFSVDSKLNPYGFIFMRQNWLLTLGWKKDMKVRIEKNADSSITVRKA